MIEIVNACVAYGGQQVLHSVSCCVHPGKTVALVGANGSGKSTLARLMCAMRLLDRGAVRVDGFDPASSPDSRLRARELVGLVQQDPSDQIVSTLVYDEVAFGPRNLGLDEDEVCERVTDALLVTSLTGYEERDSTALSGGEQQRLALAGVLAMRPRYLVLDEATSQLDSATRPDFRKLFQDLAHRDGLGVIQVTHDPLEALACDRIIVLEAGQIAWEGTPTELLLHDELELDALFVSDSYIEALQCAVRSGYSLGRDDTPECLASWLTGHSDVLRRVLPSMTKPHSSTGARENTESGLSLHGVSFSYGDRQALNNVDLQATAGHVLLLAGCSGSGKSTLASIAAGLVKPDAGTVAAGGDPVEPGSVALVFQNPEAQMFLDTVGDELAFAPRNLGCYEDEVARRVQNAAERVGLDPQLLKRYPFDLSGGQARRVAIASMLTLEAPVCILDEPSAGLDARGRRFAHTLVRTLAQEGKAIMVISHDLAEWIDVADDVVLMQSGTISWRGTVDDVRRDPSAFEGSGLAVPMALQLQAQLIKGGCKGATQ